MIINNLKQIYQPNFTANVMPKNCAEHINNKLKQAKTVDIFCHTSSDEDTFNSAKAEEYLAGNWDELADALDEFGESGVDAFRKGAEWCDVTLRCYYLGQAISAALEDFEAEVEEAHQDEEDED